MGQSSFPHDRELLTLSWQLSFKKFMKENECDKKAVGK